MSVQYGIPALFAFGDIDDESPLHAASLEPAAAEAEEADGNETEELSGIHGEAEAIHVLYQAGLKSA